MERRRDVIIMIRISTIILLLIFTLGWPQPVSTQAITSIQMSNTGNSRPERDAGFKYFRLHEFFSNLPRNVGEAAIFINNLVQSAVLTPVPVEKEIIISLENQKLYKLENGRIIESFPVSSGVNGHRTPTGKFKVHSKTPHAWSNKYECSMLNWMAFTNDGLYGLHALKGTKYLNKLGRRASHGCVRLSPDAAITLYEWADVGTPVTIDASFDPSPHIVRHQAGITSSDREQVVF